MTENKTLGNYLKNLRESKNISIEELASKSKIHLSTLKNLENDFTSLTQKPLTSHLVNLVKCYTKSMNESHVEALQFIEKDNYDLHAFTMKKIPGKFSWRYFILPLALVLIFGILYLLSALKFESPKKIIPVAPLPVKDVPQNIPSPKKLEPVSLNEDVFKNFTEYTEEGEFAWDKTKSEHIYLYSYEGESYIRFSADNAPVKTILMTQYMKYLVQGNSIALWVSLPQNLRIFHNRTLIKDQLNEYVFPKQEKKITPLFKRNEKNIWILAPST